MADKQENFKTEKWFFITHGKKCTICGKEFVNGDESFIGHLDSGELAHTCKECSSNMSDARLYSISGNITARFHDLLQSYGGIWI